VAQLRDAYGLIGAFAAVEGAKILADDGLAGEGDVIGGGDEIEIDAAYDYYWLTHFCAGLPVCGSRIRARR